LEKAKIYCQQYTFPELEMFSSKRQNEKGSLITEAAFCYFKNGA